MEQKTYMKRNWKVACIYIAEWAGWLNFVDRDIVRSYLSSAGYPMPNWKVACIYIAEWAGWLNFVDRDIVRSYLSSAGYSMPEPPTDVIRLPKISWHKLNLKLWDTIGLIFFMLFFASIVLGPAFLLISGSLYFFFPGNLLLISVVVSMISTLFFIALIRDKSICLPGDALIATPRGNVCIQDIHRGDVVWSWNVATAERVASNVTSRKTHRPTDIFKITLEDTDIPLYTTIHHSFLTQRGWCRCAKLKLGDSLLRICDSEGPVFKSILTIEKTQRKEPVYNLHTTINHNFISEGIVAHNFTNLRSIRTYLHRLLKDPFFHVGPLKVCDIVYTPSSDSITVSGTPKVPLHRGKAPKYMESQSP